MKFIFPKLKFSAYKKKTGFTQKNTYKIAFEYTLSMQKV